MYIYKLNEFLKFNSSQISLTKKLIMSILIIITLLLAACNTIPTSTNTPTVPSISKSPPSPTLVLNDSWTGVIVNADIIVSGNITDQKLEWVNMTGQPKRTFSIPINATIQINFSEPMNQTATQTAFSTSPSVSGSFNWTSANVIVFTPTNNLSSQTTYNITIGTSATDLVGNNMTAPYYFNFTTE